MVFSKEQITNNDEFIFKKSMTKPDHSVFTPRKCNMFINQTKDKQSDQQDHLFTGCRKSQLTNGESRENGF